MIIYGLNVCNNVSMSQYMCRYYILVCLHFAVIIVHRLINFYVSQIMCTCTYMCVCVFLMYLILINASPCFVHAVQES